MKHIFLIGMIGVFVFAGASEMQDSVVCTETMFGEKTVIGEIEWVDLTHYKLQLKARIDTGATTTSVDARNIKVQNQDGREWALFDIVDRQTKKRIHLEKPVVRMAGIKRHGAEEESRPVVKMHVRIGKVEKYIEVTLTDRSKYDYPVLIGRNMLRDAFVVDVSKKETVASDSNITGERE